MIVNFLSNFCKFSQKSIDIYLPRLYNNKSHRGVAQLVAHVVWDHGAAGSIPVTSTNLTKSCELVVEPITGFFVFKNNATVMQR